MFSLLSRSWLLLCILATATAITITADSSQNGNGVALSIDNNLTTFWHTEYSPVLAQLPHNVTMDLGAAKLLQGFVYTPRQDGNSNGNVGQFTLEVSLDSSAWTQVASSTFIDDPSPKEIGFTKRMVRYFRFSALSEAGNRGPWSSAAEFNYTLAPTNTSLGQWGPVFMLPIVPAAAFIQSTTGKVMTFSSYSVNTFGGANGYTLTASYDPATGTASERNMSETKHDMFCPGMSMDANGQAVITGGDDASKTSIFDSTTNTWLVGGQMNLGRGYQASASLSDGRIWTIGGSWSGNQAQKEGEVFNTTTNIWTLLPGCPVAPMLTADSQGIFRQDNHGWFFGWKSASIFQAGPSKAMNWYSAAGTGGQAAAGTRASDPDSMNGNAVMYDAVAGKILTLGGSPDYQDSYATNAAHLITITNPNSMPTVSTLTPMHYARAFATGVILADGKVMVTGGQTYAVPFTDTNSIMNPELWDPATQAFTVLPAHTVPRNYHSVALLLADGTVFTAGGGLCGSCSTNHADGQVYSPAYLFNADGSAATRPVISSVSPTTLKYGASITVKTGAAVATWRIIRMGSNTHTVNTDQRAITLTPTTTSGTTYTLTITNDPGIALPGYWMLFALNSAGVPSLAKTIKITN